MSDRKCDGCGLHPGTTPNIAIRLVNGGLTLCRDCLDEMNRKNPLIAERDALKQECERLKQVGDEELSAYSGCIDQRNIALERADAAIASRDAHRAALVELVACRELEEWIRRWGEDGNLTNLRQQRIEYDAKDEELARRRPIAWDAARTLLTTDTPATKGD